MSKKRLKVIYLEHVVYPHHFPIFEELAKQFDFTVYFCKAKKRFRRWDVSIPSRLSFKAEILKGLSIGPITINFILPFRLILEQYDVYMVATIDLITITQLIIMLVIAKIRRCPFILVDEFIETPWYSYTHPLKKRLNDWLRKALYKHVDAFVALNRKAALYMSKQGVPKDKIFVGLHFYPIEWLSRATLSKDDSPFKGKKVVLTISYLLPRKGIDYLIEAFKEIKGNDIILIIAGSGKYEAKLRALANGDPRIKFVGYVEGEDKTKYYRWADIFVLPTLWDPWGLVVNEAMYFGLPIIVTDAAGCSDHLVKDNGFVVQAGDKEALKEALVRLLNDEELRKKMGEKSKEIIKECDIYAMIRPIVEAVEYVITKNKYIK